MVRIVRTPSFARHVFSANDLSGHEDGIQFTPSELKRRKKYRAQNNLKEPIHEEVIPLTCGRKVSE